MRDTPGELSDDDDHGQPELQTGGGEKSTQIFAGLER